MRAGSRATRFLGPLLGHGPAQAFLKKRIRSGAPGPTDEERARGKGLLWGEAVDDAGRAVVSRLTTPEGYTLTALTSLLIVSKVLAGSAPAGFQTPSTAYGPDLILEVEGVTARGRRLTSRRRAVSPQVFSFRSYFMMAAWRPPFSRSSA